MTRCRQPAANIGGVAARRVLRAAAKWPGVEEKHFIVSELRTEVRGLIYRWFASAVSLPGC
jgi:hypothetical protein